MCFILGLAMAVVLSGCAVVDGGIEVGKTFWGSSTRALEKARTNAITKTYDKPYWDTVRAAHEVIAKNRYEVFKRDDVHGYAVLMGVRGSVNTTEVGVFFVEVGENQTRIELSSLSTNAKRMVAKNLFHGLDIAFGLIPPDPEEETVPAEDVPHT